MEYSEKAAQIRLGIYEHYKGNQYEVLFVGRHSETLEEVVIYRALYGDQGIWIRPLEMFLEDVNLSNGDVVPRFRHLHGR